MADNPDLNKYSVEIRYSEDDNAKWGFSYPTTESMPQKINEIATSAIVLDALNIPHEIGQEVPLEFEVKGVSYEETFTLSGFWEGDTVNISQQAFLSREFVDSVVEIPTVS